MNMKSLCLWLIILVVENCVSFIQRSFQQDEIIFIESLLSFWEDNKMECTKHILFQGNLSKFMP